MPSLVIGRNVATVIDIAKFTGVVLVHIVAKAAHIVIVAMVALVTMVAVDGRVCCYACFWRNRCFLDSVQ